MSRFDELMEKNGVENVKQDLIGELSAKLDALMTYTGLTVRRTARGVFEVVKDEKPIGDYTRPIQIPDTGLTTEAGLWYFTTDPEMPHEARRDAYVTPDDFNDSAWFDA